MKSYYSVTIMMFIMACASGTAQALDNDVLLREARKMAAEGRWEDARGNCGKILSNCPDCNDARLLLGRLYYWEKNYDAARVEIARVLDDKPDNAESRVALIDVELGAKNPKAALKFCDEGLDIDPENAEILFKKSVALELAASQDEASKSADEQLKLDLEHMNGIKRANNLDIVKKGIETERSVAAGYTYQSFSGQTSSWRGFFVEHSNGFSIGAADIRAKFADRGVSESWQLETDLYPELSKRSYVLINAGVSDGDVYPLARAGMEIFYSAPAGLDVSAGFRYLNFSESNARIYTVSLGYNNGNWLVSMRPYYSSNDDGGDVSGSLTVRRYMGGAGEYATIVFGLGADSYECETVMDRAKVDSARLSIDRQWEIDRKLLFNLLLGYEDEEYYVGHKRKKYTISASVKHLY